MGTPNMELKRINRNRIFRSILRKGTTSKAEIAYELQISLPTVTQNIAALKAEGLVVESGEYESTGGRRAKMLSCSARARVAVGINVTRNHISAVVMDLFGGLIDSVRESWDCIDTQSTIRKIQELTERMLIANAIDDQTVLGVGIALPAIIDTDNLTVKTALVVPLPMDFYQQLRTYIRFPYALFNDANCGGFAELWSRRPMERDIFYFSLSGTVGGAAVINNQIYTGCDFTGGEVGHMTLVPNGRRCYCGKRGCVDCYCSSNRLAELAPNGDLAAFFAAYQRGDAAAQQRMEEYLDYLTVAIHNVRMLFDCNIILGGYVGSYSHLFLDALKKRLFAADTFGHDVSYVTGCHYNTEAAAVGAALMYTSKFIDTI